MTTLKEIKKLCEPLLARNADLILVGRAIILKPVRHLLRCIMLDRMRSKERFRPSFERKHMFEPRRDFPLTVEGIFYDPFGAWLLTDPEISNRFIKKVEQDVLPVLRRIDTISAYVEAVMPSDLKVRAQFKRIDLLFQIALGEFDTARILLADKQCLPDLKIFNDHRPGLGDRLLREGANISHADRTTFANLLRDWEATTARNLKIEHLWTPTPFPFEEAAG